MSTRVVHVRRDAFTKYVGRPMPGFRSIGWGNPFRGDNAIAKYRQWIQSQPLLLARLPELKGKTLGCWCAPKGGLPADINGRYCHGQVLAALADGATIGSETSEGMHEPAPTIKTLSLTQPWATLVAIGAKQIETRSWSPGPRGLPPGSRLAIHASKGFPADARDLCDIEPFASALWVAGISDWRELPLGMVIATVRFDNVLRTRELPNLPPVERAFGNFASGRYAWFLSDPHPVSPPVPARGSLGLWEWEMPAAETRVAS